MGRADYMKLGDWNALCDRCQRKYKASQLRKEWTGFMVCKKCYEPRHPQEFLKGRKEDENVSWTRPDSNADTSVTTVDGNLLITDNYYDTVGDVGKTLIVGTHNPVQEWNTELTADRGALLDTSNAQEGDRWSIYRTAGGDFDLIIRVPFSYTVKVTRIKSLTVVKYKNGRWELESYTPLGL